jgi:F-type H+-transporting ATPase subunit gamma
VTNTIASLRRKIVGAGDLLSVVRTMKAVAASSVAQYEDSVHALADYNRTTELGLGVCFRRGGHAAWISQPEPPSPRRPIGAVVFGSDQGLVGRFNDTVADHAIQSLRKMRGEPQVWAVGERVQRRLTDRGLAPLGLFPVPTSVKAITPLIGHILLEHETHHGRREGAELHLFYHRSLAGSVSAPVSKRLLPLDATWHRNLAKLSWPTQNLPEVVGGDTAALRALIREYLFVSLFQACAESLASENTSRLMAMQRAEKNINELLEALHGNFHRLRQSSIDEELFDVISGFEALSVEGSGNDAR